MILPRALLATLAAAACVAVTAAGSAAGATTTAAPVTPGGPDVAGVHAVRDGGTSPTPADAGPVEPSRTTVGGVDLGPNTYLFTPDMTTSEIQATFDSIAAQQLGNQFGPERYALLFAPGTYGTPDQPLNVQVGYYTEVAGLGKDPDDVIINGTVDVYNQCDNGNCIALNNFWRSLSNLTVNVAGKDADGCHANTMFWATSQAASMRRVVVNGAFSLMDYCTGPAYASGGFIADSAFSATVINGSQQQFLVRNSQLNGWSNGVWNQTFVGTEGAPAESFGPATNQYTTIARTPVEREKPYLFLTGNGRPRVFVPSTSSNTSGTSWGAGTSTPGTTLPLRSFYVATPDSTVEKMDRALAKGRNLLLTPGDYDLTSALQVTQPGTVVLGLGLPTLTPSAGTPAIQVAGGASRIDLAGFVVDAGPEESASLIRLKPTVGRPDPTPSALHDVYLRVGGATAGKVRRALVVDASNVVLDNVWSWRADHGTGVGWDQNTAANGLVVTGSDVTAYGLFVEHYQDDQVVWSGKRGSVYMFQNEMPYDPPSQAAWDDDATGDFLGHAAFVVADGAKAFRGYGMGAYSFFNQGQDIHATQAFTVADGVDARLHHVLTVFLDGAGGIDSVVDRVGAPVTSANPGTPSTVTDYPSGG